MHETRACMRWMWLFHVIPGHNTIIAHDLGKDPSSPSLHGTHSIITPKQQRVTFITMCFLAEKTTEYQSSLKQASTEQSKQSLYKVNAKRGQQVNDRTSKQTSKQANCKVHADMYDQMQGNIYLSMRRPSYSSQIPYLDELFKFFEMSLFESISVVIQHLYLFVFVQMILIGPEIGVLGLIERFETQFCG